MRLTRTTQVTFCISKSIYNLVIKYGLPLKLELTGSVDACPPQNNHAMHIFQQVMSTTLTQATNTYRHISRNIGATMTASRKLAF